MNRLLTLTLAAGLALGLSASAASAARKVKPAKMTCEEFVALGEKDQPAVVAYLDGYNQGKKMQQEVGELDVERQVGEIVTDCKTTPKLTLAEKVLKHVPGGKKLIKPAKMTCEEYATLAESKQPLVYYFASGYDHATKKVTEEAGSLDLDTDVATVVRECKTAPKESVWAKLKKHL